MYRVAVAAILALTLAACASQPVAIPANARIGTAVALPTPARTVNDAPPRILALNFSSTAVRRGDTWSGTIVTTTNVASVEVRTNLFSIDVPRRTFGDFHFDLRVYDVPPIFIRGYRVRVIARNSVGQSAEEDLPLDIR
ncbi:MAG TPA: hypothetical protein VIO32_02810 [Candidatus Baltobacteraceae bacterium]